MQLQAFRITNFKSIADSGWVTLSADGVTVLIGQNESGKTSILHALFSVLGSRSLSPDDRRVNAPDPVVYLKVKADTGNVNADVLTEYRDVHMGLLRTFLDEHGPQIDLQVDWRSKPGSPQVSERHVIPIGFEALLDKIETADAIRSAEQIANDTKEALTADAIGMIFWYALPLGVFFSAETGLLPNSIDIDEKSKPTGSGVQAASNFLTIAEIDVGKLVNGDGRYRTNVLNKANQKITQDFASFWSQVIGSGSKLSLHCGFEYHSAATADKAGKPYLEFWVSDGNTQLYPRQRSEGVRWFVSFYLQFRATEKAGHNRLFLLDEPGANLHEKAQGDVLRLIDKLRTDIPVVYSTHSPSMIEYDKIFRIKAVQRDSQQEDSPTIIIDAQHLGSASSDTLSPLMTAMGSDMSRQSVIKKSRNVLIEEISGYYYLTAFWSLLKVSDEANFIAATGVNKVPLLANMFLGWGLDFVVAVDDDKQGREVYNQLKKDLCGDQEDLAKSRLLKLPSGSSIEEVFSPVSFAKFILRDPAAVVTDGNAEYMKSAKLSKPVAALQFLLSVQSGEITRKHLDDASLDRIQTLVDGILKVLGTRESGSGKTTSRRG